MLAILRASGDINWINTESREKLKSFLPFCISQWYFYWFLSLNQMSRLFGFKEFNMVLKTTKLFLFSHSLVLNQT